ncbi:bifunctional triacylglycerol lipase/ester hydrolase [Aspergillus saccharolyticus JOP 1030-1]|uniref:Lipid droplet-associated hydrolase n=1 Tax=Aspergillus saccharolyticus JOP 1030-1 TaxID=1450539 RepID=A0A318Z409_9EURO|nr:hypothetical protein BP01DRAFT_360085 [Aspergillus saccharolyticus JOP 1030-1]PYH41739.1 hypothetical protein BP01DRAFT_360085 [Aspergillus saccharolyticus JOP 1030-1]
MSSRLDPHMTADSFFHTLGDQKSSASPSRSPVLIYFISGNPGLISYYYPFFTHLIDRLQTLVSKHDEKPTIHIHGHSLAGFELSAPHTTAAVADEEPYYHDLEDQIRFVQRKLDTCVSSISGGHPSSAPANTTEDGPPITTPPTVLLIGHSVGTYIAMELIRRHRARASSSPSAGPLSGTVNHPSFTISGGILLFPTVVDIAKSPSGRKLTTLLSILPHLALIAGLFARVLTTLLPGFVLRGLVKVFMGFPPDEAVDTTCGFLRSRRGVRQALHMAASEMYTINSDKWADEVWGISATNDEKHPLTKLFFYYGRGDHWVAEETREEIIALRGKGAVGSQNGGATTPTQGCSGPTMVVCEEGLPHAFCLRHSEVMAGKVAEMVKEIIG